jgi:hypothetical protein
MTRRGLTVDDIRRLLEELGRRLNAKGVHTTLYVVGGAAMALTVNPRRVTEDIDSMFEPDTVLWQTVREMATDHHLPPSWLNDNARHLAPTGEDTPRVLFDHGGVTVTVAAPRHLLAAKMAAFRPKDYDDLIQLFRVVGITSAEQATDIVFDIYGDYAEMFGPRDDYLLRARDILYRMGRTAGPGAVSEVDELLDAAGTPGGEPAPRRGRRHGRNAVSSAAAPRKVRCPHRTTNGSRCRNELLPGSRCPAHGWRAPT